MLLEHLRTGYGLSNTEKALATYILNNPETSLRMTLQKLSSAAFVSKPTVIRLYKKLGVKSFSDFKVTLSSEFSKDNEKIKDIDPNLPFKRRETYQNIARSLCELSLQTIFNCYLMFDNEIITKIVSILTSSKHIFIYAIGDSFIRARSFQNKLIKINKYVCLVNEMHEAETHMYNASVNDCVLFLSFSGNLLKQYKKHAMLLKKRGIKTILISSITDFESTKLFDHVIRLHKGEDDFLKIATFSSQIGMDYVLNLLYSCLFEQDYDQNVERINESYEFFKDQGLM